MAHCAPRRRRGPVRLAKSVNSYQVLGSSLLHASGYRRGGLAQVWWLRKRSSSPLVKGQRHDGNGVNQVVCVRRTMVPGQQIVGVDDWMQGMLTGANRGNSFTMNQLHCVPRIKSRAWQQDWVTYRASKGSRTSASTVARTTYLSRFGM